MSSHQHAPSVLFMGCYTKGAGGEGTGIAVAPRDPVSGAVGAAITVAATPAPSFVARHPSQDLLYAVNELDEGGLTAFRVHPDHTLTELGSWPTGGAEPCHVAVDPGGRHVLVANYGGGSVAVFELDDDGVPTKRSDLVAHRGSGPHPQRQRGPHTHSVWPAEDGVLVLDLGVDTVFSYPLDRATGQLGEPEVAIRPRPGTGPRHLVRTGPDTLHLVGELSGTITTYTRTGGQWHDAGTVATSVLRGATPSEIAADASGRFLYVANRGPDTIAAFALSSGLPVRVGEVSSGGEWPRHFALAGRFLYVANERSHLVVTFGLDPSTGVPIPTGDVLVTPSPTCILPWPWP